MSQPRPTQFSLLALAAITSGIGLLLAAVGPMLAALVISNRIIDDGPHPGDQAIMEQWDTWAFSFKNWALLLAGLLMMMLGFFRCFGRRGLPEASAVDSGHGSQDVKSSELALNGPDCRLSGIRTGHFGPRACCAPHEAVGVQPRDLAAKPKSTTTNAQ